MPEQTYGARVQEGVMRAIVDCSMSETDGERIARIQTAEVLDAFSLITASLIATAPEAQTDEGLRRMLRRQARQLEDRVVEFRRYTAERGSPFVTPVEHG